MINLLGRGWSATWWGIGLGEMQRSRGLQRSLAEAPGSGLPFCPFTDLGPFAHRSSSREGVGRPNFGFWVDGPVRGL